MQWMLLSEFLSDSESKGDYRAQCFLGTQKVANFPFGQQLYVNQRLTYEDSFLEAAVCVCVCVHLHWLQASGFLAKSCLIQINQ